MNDALFRIICGAIIGAVLYLLVCQALNYYNPYLPIPHVVWQYAAYGAIGLGALVGLLSHN